MNSARRWYARITLAPKVRRAIPLPTCETEEQAEARKDVLVAIVRDLRGAEVPLETVEKLLKMAGEREGKALREVQAAAAALARGDARPKAGKPSKSETFGNIAKRWTSGELARLYPDHVKVRRSMEHEGYRMERYILPLVGDVPIVDFELEHAEMVMAALPAERAPGTRRHVGQIMHRILAMAVYPLKLRAANPIPRGFLPKKGKGKLKAWLYPDEDARLMASAAVPLCYRVFYGFLHREGPRFSEAASLDVGDADLDRGAVNLEENKTDDPRAWALSPGDAPALRAWLRWRKTRGEKITPSSPLFVDAKGARFKEDGNNARQFRDHLKAAGIDRAELFESTAARMRIRLHDARGTFVTISLALGRSETWVMDRTGHRSSEMIQLYRRAARKAAELNLGPLLPLDEAIPELRVKPGGPPAEASQPPAEASQGGADAGEASSTQVVNHGDRNVSQRGARAGSDSGSRRARCRKGFETKGDTRGHHDSVTIARDDSPAGEGVGDGALDRARRPADDGDLRAEGSPWFIVAADANEGAPVTAAEPKSTSTSRSTPLAAEPSPRAALIEALSLAMRKALEAGDLEAARVAYEAIGKLLASPPAQAGAEVVSLADAAARRREGSR